MCLSSRPASGVRPCVRPSVRPCGVRPISFLKLNCTIFCDLRERKSPVPGDRPVSFLKLNCTIFYDLRGRKMGPFIIKLSKYESFTWHRFGAKIAVLFQAKLHNNLRFKSENVSGLASGVRAASVRPPCLFFEAKLHNNLRF